jgi:hypothetical protein
MPQQQIPLTIAIAPFPEGFQGDMDETFQQGVQLMEAYIEGNFLTGLILPPGSTLPTTDQGPIAMGGQWYFWNDATQSYQPQTVPTKAATNYAKNSAYQVQQTGATFNPPNGVSQTYDLALFRNTQAAGFVTINADTGPIAGADNDPIVSAIRYTVGPSLLPSPAATDLVTHEHIFEGIDISPLIGQTLSLSFSFWTNTPGNYSAYLTSAGRDVSIVLPFQIVTPNQWTRIKFPGLPPLPTGQGTWNFSEGVTGLYFGLPLAIGTQWQTANANSWQNQFVGGTSANINLLSVANNQIKLTGLKLEAAASVSYYSMPVFDADYWQATRYYWTGFGYQSQTPSIPTFGQCPLDGQWIIAQLFAHRMCKNPNVVPYSYLTPANPGFVSDLSTAFEIPKATLVAMRKGMNDSATLTAVSVTGNTTSASAVVTAVSSTANLKALMPISGAGIPFGTVIRSVDSGTQITLSQAATATATAVALTVNQTRRGDTLACYLVADARLS